MKRKASGFTLIELLVCIAIIGMLASLMIPFVGSSMERGRTAKCKGHLRAMSNAVHAYVAEHDGVFPLALETTDQGSRGWDFIISRGPSGREVNPGLIWESYGVNSVLQCPSFAGSDNWQGEEHTGYNYNASYLGGMRMEIGGTVFMNVPSARVTQVTTPSETAMFGDGEYAAGANKFMRSPEPGALDAGFFGRHAGTQGFRHRGKTMVAFVDGHVKAMAPVAAPSSLAAEVAPGTGFLSVDNSLYDLQ